LTERAAANQITDDSQSHAGEDRAYRNECAINPHEHNHDTQCEANIDYLKKAPEEKNEERKQKQFSSERTSERLGNGDSESTGGELRPETPSFTGTSTTIVHHC
jgi:hypothetical protein